MKKLKTRFRKRKTLINGIINKKINKQKMRKTLKNNFLEQIHN